jgi:hypothetical protein
MLAKAKDLEDRVEKAGWEAPATEGSLQGPSHFEIETGGRIAHRPQYWTNQSLIEVEDVTNKGTIEESDPTTMMDAPPHDYGPTGSTLHDHVSGSDENPVSLTKSEDRVVGSIQGGDALRLHEVARAAENLARRLS